MARQKAKALERIDIDNKIAAMWRDERDKAVYLLEVVDPGRDAVRGEWILIGGVLCNKVRRSEWTALEIRCACRPNMTSSSLSSCVPTRQLSSASAS